MSISGQERMRISIHTSAREVTPLYCICTFAPRFQSTLPQGKWLLSNRDWGIISNNFNPHFRKGSDSFLFLPFLWYIYFNPHFRKGSDDYVWHLLYRSTISIHTSAREVTAGKVKIPVRDTISIHTSAREVTYIDHKQILNEYISIHTSAREVTLDCAVFFSITTISIHTSAREVTAADSFIPSKALDFNPHFRKGSDDIEHTPKIILFYFNPHFRKGSDNKITGKAINFIDFNPHFRKGSDVCAELKVNTMENFNPHFRKGSDADDPGWLGTDETISIHTSAREVTNPLTYGSHFPPNFNPHFRKGSDLTDDAFATQNFPFQSTLPQGKWPGWIAVWLLCHRYFNPHFRKGSDFLCSKLVQR